MNKAILNLVIMGALLFTLNGFAMPNSELQPMKQQFIQNKIQIQEQQGKLIIKADNLKTIISNLGYDPKNDFTLFLQSTPPISAEFYTPGQAPKAVTVYQNILQKSQCFNIQNAQNKLVQFCIAGDKLFVMNLMCTMHCGIDSKSSLPYKIQAEQNQNTLVIKQNPFYQQITFDPRQSLNLNFTWNNQLYTQHLTLQKKPGLLMTWLSKAEPKS